MPACSADHHNPSTPPPPTFCPTGWLAASCVAGGTGLLVLIAVLEAIPVRIARLLTVLDVFLFTAALIMLTARYVVRRLQADLQVIKEQATSMRAEVAEIKDRLEHATSQAWWSGYGQCARDLNPQGSDVIRLPQRTASQRPAN